MHVCACPEVCGVRSGVSVGGGLLELLDGWGHLDVLASLQPLLTLDEIVDAVDDRLHQLDLGAKDCENVNVKEKKRVAVP